jgi:hypothetical protein
MQHSVLNAESGYWRDTRCGARRAPGSWALVGQMSHGPWQTGAVKATAKGWHDHVLVPRRVPEMTCAWHSGATSAPHNSTLFESPSQSRMCGVGCDPSLFELYIVGSTIDFFA